MSVHCRWAFHLGECRSPTQTTYPSHRYPDGSFQTTHSPVKGRTTQLLTYCQDPGKVSLSVLLLFLVTGRILPIQNSRKQESENTSISWFLHTLGEARTVERRR